MNAVERELAKHAANCTRVICDVAGCGEMKNQLNQQWVPEERARIIGILCEGLRPHFETVGIKRTSDGHGAPYPTVTHEGHTIDAMVRVETYWGPRGRRAGWGSRIAPREVSIRWRVGGPLTRAYFRRPPKDGFTEKNLKPTIRKLVEAIKDEIAWRKGYAEKERQDKAAEKTRESFLRENNLKSFESFGPVWIRLYRADRGDEIRVEIKNNLSPAAAKRLIDAIRGAFPESEDSDDS